MINKDPVFWLKQIKERYIKGGDEKFDSCRKEAIDTAIEALQKRKTGKWEVYTDGFANLLRCTAEGCGSSVLIFVRNALV